MVIFIVYSLLYALVIVICAYSIHKTWPSNNKPKRMMKSPVPQNYHYPEPKLLNRLLSVRIVLEVILNRFLRHPQRHWNHRSNRFCSAH